MVRARVDRTRKQSNSELLTAVNRVQRSLIHGENPQQLLRELLRELIVQVGCESGFIAKCADKNAANGDQHQLNLQAIDCSNTLAQKPLEEAAEQRHYSLLNTVMNGLPDLIFIKDLEGRLVFVNDATARLVGTNVSEIVGKTDSDILPPEVAARTQQFDQQVFETGEAVTYEEDLPSPAGIQRYVTTKTPWRNSHGQLIGLLGIARNVSEQRAYQETIERQRSELFHVSVDDDGTDDR